MKAVYFIGNGFDIACGLGTEARRIVTLYRDVLRADMEKLENTESVEARAYGIFLDSIEDDIDSWADFETKIGELTIAFDDEENAAECFEIAFSHFRQFLRYYLIDRQERVNDIELHKSTVAGFYTKCKGFLASGMRPNQRAVLDDFLGMRRKESWSVEFIVFNYTYLVDRLVDAASGISQLETISNTSYGRKLIEPLHIHGSLCDEYGIVVGVDDPRQVASEKLRRDEDVLDMLVKPRLNLNMGLLRDTKAGQMIGAADIIVVHGMSLGETDKTWWRKIGKWLFANPKSRLLVLSEYDPSVSLECNSRPELYFRKMRQCRDRFMKIAEVPQDKMEQCSERILVVFNTDDFTNALSPVIRDLRSDLADS